MMSGLHFVTVGFPGVQRWLENGTAEGLWGLTVLRDGERAEVPAAESYGVGAWHDGYEAVYKNVRARGVPFGIAWSSSPQESDTERTRQELGVLIALTSEASPVRPDWWACLDPNLAKVLPGGVHLPAPIHVEEVPERAKEEWIGFFVPPTEKKAIFSQLLAVREFQRAHPGVRLQTNLAAYQPVMDWLGLTYDLHPWLPRATYLELLARCKVVLHASLAESWGYGVVDALMAGTPVVGSPTVGWLPAAWIALNPNSPASVAVVLDCVWGDEVPPAWEDAPCTTDPKVYVKRVARVNNAAARVAVERILSAKHK